MNVNLYSRLHGGRVHTMEMPADAAARAFDAHKKLVSIPWAATYRVTLTDRQRGGHIVRDTDLEVFGIKGRLQVSDTDSITPSTIRHNPGESQ